MMVFAILVYLGSGLILYTAYIFLRIEKMAKAEPVFLPRKKIRIQLFLSAVFIFVGCMGAVVMKYFGPNL